MPLLCDRGVVLPHGIQVQAQRGGCLCGHHDGGVYGLLRDRFREDRCLGGGHIHPRRLHVLIVDREIVGECGLLLGESTRLGGIRGSILKLILESEI